MKEGEVPPGVPPSDRIVEIGGRPDAKAEGRISRQLEAYLASLRHPDHPHCRRQHAGHVSWVAKEALTLPPSSYSLRHTILHAFCMHSACILPPA